MFNLVQLREVSVKCPCKKSVISEAKTSGSRRDMKCDFNLGFRYDI